MKKFYKPLTNTIKETSPDITKPMMEISEENNKPLEILNNKLLEIMNYSGIIASSLLSPLSKINNRDQTSQFNLVEDSNSKSVNDLVINKTVPVTLYKNLLRFRDLDKEFELQLDLSKMITNKNYNVDLAILPDKKFFYEIVKEYYIDVKTLGKKINRVK